MNPVTAALLVMVLDPIHRAWMAANDPKALEQALTALEADAHGRIALGLAGRLHGAEQHAGEDRCFYYGGCNKPASTRVRGIGLHVHTS